MLSNLLLTPWLTHALLLGIGLDEHGGWLVLVAAAPVAGGAVVVALLLGLRLRPLVQAQLLSFFLLGVTAPLVAALVLEGTSLDGGALFLRILALAGGSALLGLLLRRLLGERRRAELADPCEALARWRSVAWALRRGESGTNGNAALLEVAAGLVVASLACSLLAFVAAALIAAGLWWSFVVGVQFET